MARVFRSKGFRSLAIALGIVAFGGILAWRVMQPKIRLATLEQIRSVVPKELLVETPSDPAAVKRYLSLTALIQSIDAKELGSVSNYSSMPPGSSRSAFGGPGGSSSTPEKPENDQQFADVERLWKNHPIVWSKLKALVDDGSIQRPPVDPKRADGFTDSVSMKGFIKALAISARLYAEHGDFGKATDLAVVDLQLVNRLFANCQYTIDYLVDIAYESIVMAAVKSMAADPRFPLPDCRRLLTTIAAAPRVDGVAAKAVQSDFLRMELIELSANPAKEFSNPRSLFSTSDPTDEAQPEPFCGTYDALATAQLAGEDFLAQMANLRKPYAEYDWSSDHRIDRLTKNLPVPDYAKEQDGIRKSWDTFRYRFVMNNSHNSVGLGLLAQMAQGSSLVELSCRWRTIHDATRVLLASRIYRASHSGRLPESTDGFVAILGGWPQDPFNGKPMQYRSKLERVYAVGVNLFDDGGDIGHGSFRDRDIGLSLMLNETRHFSPVWRIRQTNGFD
ncbi:MAG: hypothetical protein P4L46_05675 [Fimbriimonas sp.]|nr:hypothetical protein [Fimbriimonas sp.]